MKIISDWDDALRTTTTTTPPATATAPAEQTVPLEYDRAPVAAQQATPPEGDGPAPSGRRARAFVVAAITCSVLIVLGATFSVWYRWQKDRLPTSYILLYGDETTANADVTVIAGRREIARVTLSEAEQYQKPVLVEPGPYRIEARMNGTLVFIAQVFLPDNARGVMINITLRPEGLAGAGLPPGARAYRPGTRPASRPGG